MPIHDNQIGTYKGVALYDDVEIDARDYESLAMAMLAAEGSGKTIVISKNMTLSGVVNIPVGIRFVNGAGFTIAPGAVVTISGAFNAGDYPVFVNAVPGSIKGLHRADPRWWGAVADGVADDSNAVQCAIDSLEIISDLTIDGASAVVTSAAGQFGLGSTVQVRKSDGIVLRDMSFVAVGGAWSSTTPMLSLLVTAAGATLDGLTLDGGKVAAGIQSNVRSHIKDCNIFHFRGYGIKGIKGDINIRDNLITQWFNGDAEFLDPDNFDAIGIWVNANDINIFHNIVRWVGIGLYFDVDASTTQVINNHVYCGNSGMYVPVVSDKMKLIVKVKFSGQQRFVGNYFDNGNIDLYNHNAVFEHNVALYNAAASLQTYFVSVFATGDAAPYGLVMRNWQSYSPSLVDGTVPFVVFVNGPLGEVWDAAGDFSNILLVNETGIVPGAGRASMSSFNTADKSILSLISIYGSASGAKLDFFDKDTTFATPPHARSAGNDLVLFGAAIDQLNTNARQVFQPAVYGSAATELTKVSFAFPVGPDTDHTYVLLAVKNGGVAVAASGFVGTITVARGSAANPQRYGRFFVDVRSADVTEIKAAFQSPGSSLVTGGLVYLTYDGVDYIALDINFGAALGRNVIVEGLLQSGSSFVPLHLESTDVAGVTGIETLGTQSVVYTGLTDTTAGALIADGACAVVTAAVVGARAGMVAVANAELGTQLEAGLVVDASVTADDVVTVRECSVLAAGVTPAARKYVVRVIK